MKITHLMVHSLQYTTKKGFIESLRVGGTRVRINERISLLGENEYHKELKLVSKLKEFETSNKLDTKTIADILVFKKKHEKLKMPKYIGHIYYADKRRVLIRTIHVRYTKKNRNFPYLFYNLWSFGIDKSFNKIEVQFKIDFHRIGSGRYEKGKRVLEYGLPEQNGSLRSFRNKFFKLSFLNKLNIFLEHQKTNFETLNWNIIKNKFQISYIKKLEKRLDIENYTKSDLFLCHKKDIQEPEFNGLHFLIDENNWIGTLAILSSHFSEKERLRPVEIGIFKRILSFSKVSFFKKLDKEKKEQKNEIRILRTNDFTEEISDSNLENLPKINTLKSNNYEILEDYMQQLKSYHKTKEFKWDLIVLLPENSADITLVSSSLIRYCRAYPILNGKNVISRIKSTKTTLDKIIIIGTKLKKEDIISLKNDNYEVLDINGNSKEDLLFNVQNFFLRAICVDNLISSFNILPEKLMKTGQSEVNLDTDIMKLREEIIHKLSEKDRKIVKYLFSKKLATNEYLKIYYNQIDLLDEKLLGKLIDLGQVIQDYRIEYTKKDRIRILISENFSAFHFSLVSLESRIPNLIPSSIYSCYKCLIQIPLNIKLLNLEGFSKIKHYYETNTNKIARLELQKSNNKFSDVLYYKWNDLIYSIFQKDNALNHQKLKTEIGLGFISLFLPLTKIPYEFLFFENRTIGSLFSISRFPIESPTFCLNVVNNCFKQYEIPKPKPKILSIVPYLDSTSEEKAHSDFTKYLIDNIFSAFYQTRIGSVASVYGSKDLANVIQLMLECNTFFFWGHGNYNGIVLRSQNPTLSVTTDLLKNCIFLQPELAILGACETASHSYIDKNANFAIFLLNKGFMGICASFWKIDITTAIHGLLNILFKFGSGHSLASIIRKNKYSHTENFPEVFISYGDPTYKLDFYYNEEKEIIQNTVNQLINENFTFENKLIFRIEEKE